MKRPRSQDGTTWPLPRAVVITLAAGAVGWSTARVAVHSGSRFPSSGYMIGELVWNGTTIGLAAWALRRFDGERFDSRTAGFTSDRPETQQSYPWRPTVVVAAGGLVASLLAGASASSGSSFGEPHKVGVALALGELLVRYPLTVVAEEALFRGILQPRLGRNGPVLSAVLWAAYHLQQTSTIPSLVLFGLVLGYLRWQRGNVRLTAALHYAGDAIFFITNYT